MEEIFKSIDGHLVISKVSETGEITYATLLRDENYWESEEFLIYPAFDHFGPTQEQAQPYDGENGPGAVILLLASAPSIAAFASMIKVYLLRNKDRKVIVSREDGTPQLEVTGNLSVDDIERLLRVQMDQSSESSTGRDESTVSDKSDENSD